MSEGKQLAIGRKVTSSGQSVREQGDVTATVTVVRTLYLHRKEAGKSSTGILIIYVGEGGKKGRGKKKEGCIRK